MTWSARQVWIACVAPVAAAMVCGALWADVAVPRKSWTSVRMEAETVQIALGHDKVKVEAVFKLYNDGNDQVCKMGYPLGVFEEALNDFAVTIDDANVTDIATLDAKAISGGGKAPGEEEGGDYQFDGPYKQWKTWNMPIKGRRQRVVKVTYWVKPAVIKDANASEMQFYCYTMKTGATWKGKIGSAEIKLTLDGMTPDQIVRRSPDGFKTADDGKTTTWKMEDFKPTSDIEVTFKPATKVASAVP